MSAAFHVTDEDIEQLRQEEADELLREAESKYYRLLRRVFISQANGDFELGNKLQDIMRDVEEPLTEAEFDACMERAAKQITL
ncbi:hypothetical protein [Noviherbaspirillum saxi]|uniref:Uncharacterized protein n=1 Tax=Noviherbaspirillum saxi TaxID=2320863 RepID=A0A3A3GDS3_9BURK|nr:hypothetical protein [Noviherbaspirillum saxi]RJF99059.1 hypothetical protein D3871_11445 [Noviherbaspirillum saxi]